MKYVKVYTIKVLNAVLQFIAKIIFKVLHLQNKCGFQITY